MSDELAKRKQEYEEQQKQLMQLFLSQQLEEDIEARQQVTNLVISAQQSTYTRAQQQQQQQQQPQIQHQSQEEIQKQPEIQRQIELQQQQQSQKPSAGCADVKLSSHRTSGDKTQEKQPEKSHHHKEKVEPVVVPAITISPTAVPSAVPVVVTSSTKSTPAAAAAPPVQTHSPTLAPNAQHDRSPSPSPSPSPSATRTSQTAIASNPPSPVERKKRRSPKTPSPPIPLTTSAEAIIPVIAPVAVPVAAPVLKPKDLDAEYFFRNVAGCDEETLRARLAEPPDSPNQPFRFGSSGELILAGKYNAGVLEVRPLGEITASLGGWPAEGSPKKEGPGPIFTIVTRTDAESLRFVDVAALQAAPENKNAMFQVASNFNVLEAISEDSLPTTPNFTEFYIYDKTQGPAASISAAPAAIARVYAAFANEKTPPSEWCQTDKRQINLLEHPDVARHLPVKNGYVCLPDDSSRGDAASIAAAKAMPEFPAAGSPEFFQLLDKCKVAVHRDVQVTYGSSGAMLSIVTEPTQCVDQVFCATVNIGQGYTGRVNRRSPNIEAKCRFTLQVAFESAYAAAIARRRKQLFLCLVGAGVFLNSIEWVWDAIRDAHVRWYRHPDCCLERVWLPLFSAGEWVSSLMIRDLTEKGMPYEWRQYTKNTLNIEATSKKD